MALQKNTQQVVQALGNILNPDATGVVRFGAAQEPLRLSQVEALQAIRDGIEKGNTTGYVVQPGGTGKTREGIALAYAMHKYGNKSLFVVPTQQALTDFAKKAKELCPDLDIGSVYEDEKHIGNLTFITYQSLLARTLGEEAAKEAAFMDETATSSPAAEKHLKINPKDYDLVVWDEAHMYMTPNASKLRNQFEHAINVGFTATPRYYEGKELGGVDALFGKKFYELSIEKALERGEISDYENVLINTDITTGLNLNSPDQEESVAVSRALNRSDRNLICAELYKNAEITTESKGRKETHNLAGEPAIVFAASVDHVHAIADTLNETLTPLLKTDKAFRQKLIDKGIDPDDPDLVIAAPIHTSGTDLHPGMNLNARNAVVEKYHQRKALMLVSTSVLQQSFDSPMTSVVMDTVPRQTYVGVGQAAMRALRPYKDKLAILINMEDADHQSLTFNQFKSDRGQEEGVAVDIKYSADKKPKARIAMNSSFSKLGSAAYTMTVGDALVDLTAKRAVARNPYYIGLHNATRQFTTLGYGEIDSLLTRIMAGDASAPSELLEVVNPWMEDIFHRQQSKLLTAHAGRKFSQLRNSPLSDKLPVLEMQERLGEVPIDVFLDTVAAVKDGALPTWTRFAQRFQRTLEKKLTSVFQNEFSADEEGVQLTRKIEHSALPQKITDSPEYREKEDLALRSLTPREEEVIKLRFFEDRKLHEIGEHFKLTGTRIAQIEAKALRKLRHPSRAQLLEPLLERMPDQDRVNALQAERDNPPLSPETLAGYALSKPTAKRVARPPILAKNLIEMKKIKSELVEQKRALSELFTNSVGYLPYSMIADCTGLTERQLYAVTDSIRTEVSHDLLEALKPGLLDRCMEDSWLSLQFRDSPHNFDEVIGKLRELTTRYHNLGGRGVTAGPYVSY